MKIVQSWKRNNPSSAGGYSITVTYTYSSFNPSEIDELEKKLPKGMLVMDTDHTEKPVTYTYSSFNPSKIDELEKKLPKGMLVMDTDHIEKQNDVDITDEDFHFGDWLKAEMKKLDWDIYDLSIESGVPDRTLADYQRNARMPKMRNLQWICQAFGKRLMIKDE